MKHLNDTEKEIAAYKRAARGWDSKFFSGGCTKREWDEAIGIIFRRIREAEEAGRSSAAQRE